MNYSYRFFENKECKYFPCHEGVEDFNCLFCYCPLYSKEHCPGSPQYIETGKQKIKDCSKCLFPHQPENYDIILQCLASEN
ncbi:MAG: metal-binding protein [Tyzzerella sp.]|nr:metal-binding protein [Tyzzerella sp.]